MYKSGQGYWTRVMTAIAGGVVLCLGAVWLWNYLDRVKIGEIPSVYVAAAGALIVLGIGAAIIYRLVVTKPSTVDFLVATEGEMKKVNWSTRREIIGSTWVVLTVTGFITLLVFLFDYAFFFLFVWMRVLDAPSID